MKALLLLLFLVISPYSFASSSSSLETDVKAKMLSVDPASIFSVSFTINNGVVTLTGTAESNLEVSKLVSAIQSVPGIKNVDTKQIVVKDASKFLSDSDITAKILGIFSQERLFGTDDVNASTINVDTKDGNVHLTGKVKTMDQAVKAKSLAESVSGVKGVDANIAVEGTKQ